jgi:hypothetical protein
LETEILIRRRLMRFKARGVIIKEYES